MNKQLRIGGGVRKSLPIYWRGEREDEDLIPHYYGNWHSARPTRMPRLSWAIHRIRRARVGQLHMGFARGSHLLNSKRVLVRARKVKPVMFWGSGIGAYPRKPHVKHS